MIILNTVASLVVKIVIYTVLLFLLVFVPCVLLVPHYCMSRPPRSISLLVSVTPPVPLCFSARLLGHRVLRVRQLLSDRLRGVSHRYLPAGAAELR